MKAESVWKQNVADHPHTHPRPVVYTILFEMGNWCVGN